MLKGGIFIDVENLTRNGGWGLRYDVLRKLAEAQGVVLVRANAYLARDAEREREDHAVAQKNEEYRNAIRRNGFHLVLKDVIRYRDATGEDVVKANADVDLAVDVLAQAENLDYILLGSGDGDFVRLVRALQNRGRRVEVISFANTSRKLRREADRYISGFLVPGLLPDDHDGPDRRRGTMYGVNEEKGFGFLQIMTGYSLEDELNNIFLHINDFTVDGTSVGNAYFARLKTDEKVIEFDLVEQEDGRLKALNATEVRYGSF